MSERTTLALDASDAEAFRVLEELFAVAKGLDARIGLTEGSLRFEARLAVQEARKRFGDSPAALLEFKLDSLTLKLWAATDAFRRGALERLAEIAEARLPGGSELLAEPIEERTGIAIRRKGASNGKAKSTDFSRGFRGRSPEGKRK